MALIEDTVGTLPYLLVDFDQHSYEAQDCFTRFMPKAKLDTAVRPIVLPSGHKALIANERLVTAFEKEHDLDKAYVPGSLAEMLRQRAGGDATVAATVADGLGGPPVRADRVRVGVAQLQHRRKGVEPVGDLGVLHYCARSSATTP